MVENLKGKTGSPKGGIQSYWTKHRRDASYESMSVFVQTNQILLTSVLSGAIYDYIISY